MSDNVPAWKRIGLKVKAALGSDPLAIATHLDSAKVTKKQVKQLNKRKREEPSADGEKKPPKRVKVAKSERAPAPEKDQLVYLATYTTDRDNWKFSKQKQNWILKHIKTIDSKYEEYLVNYLEGLQGGSRDRIVSELLKVVDSWNSAAKEPAVQSKENEQTKENSEATKKPTTVQEKPSDNSSKVEDQQSVDSDFAIRAKKIIKAISGETVELVGIDDDEEASTVTTSEGIQEDTKNDEVEIIGNDSVQPSKEHLVQSSNNVDNLIIEQVEVNEFVNDEDFEDPPKAEKKLKSKKDKKSKEKKKKKSNKSPEE